MRVAKHRLSERPVRFLGTEYTPTVHQRSPFTTINHDHLNNYFEIKKYTDLHTLSKESMVRVAKHVQEIQQGSVSVGNIGEKAV